MSRELTPAPAGGRGFPRVSGDEPVRDDLDKAIETFSPRERG